MKNLNDRTEVLRSNSGSLMKKLDDWLGSFFAGRLLMLRFVTNYAPYLVEQRFAACLAEINFDLIGSGTDSFPHCERLSFTRLLNVLICVMISLQIYPPPTDTLHSFYCQIDNFEGMDI